jgi:16S rRNA (guanine527-N7)-methyltransferase
MLSRSAFAEIWTRHVEDSMQLREHAPPDFREWVDLGSGGGFPGLVIAIAFKSKPERHFTLVESNGKKAAFLRAAIREIGVNANVAAERIEVHAPKMAGAADVVSARALAPLPKLFEFGFPYLHEDSVMLFLKGQDHVHEIETASQAWDFDVVSYESASDPGGRVLAIRHLRRKVRR